VNVVVTLLIVAAAVLGLVVARTFWGPLKWPAYAFAAWLAVVLMYWPLSATGHVWKEGLGVGWYITVVLLTIVVVVIFYGFVAYLLLRAARALVHRLR
jgi:hypothetical protein